MKTLTAVEIDEVPAKLRQVFWKARDILVFEQGSAPVFFFTNVIPQVLEEKHSNGYGHLDRGEIGVLETVLEWATSCKVDVVLMSPLH